MTSTSLPSALAVFVQALAYLARYWSLRIHSYDSISIAQVERGNGINLHPKVRAVSDS